MFQESSNNIGEGAFRDSLVQSPCFTSEEMEIQRE